MYDFEVWICPYCERIYFYRKFAIWEDPINEKAKAEMKKKLREIEKLMSAVRKCFEKKGVTIIG